jgi:hypothetical protein
MTTTDDEVNDGSDDVPPLHELVEEAPVTRASYLANAFMESFFDRFAEAELADEKKFLLDVSQFDMWMIEQNLMPNDISEDHIAQRGKASVRNMARRTINRAAAFGKSVWPPFSIEVYEPGKLYDVRLLEYFVDKLPNDLARRALGYMMNKGTYWSQMSAYMHSEAVQKRLKAAPHVMMRFHGAEGQVRLTFKNVADQLHNLNEEMTATYREARRLMAIEAQNPTG